MILSQIICNRSMKNRNMCLFKKVLSFLVLLIFILNGQSMGKSLIQAWSRDPQIAIEWYHPSFSHSELSALTSTSFISISLPVSNALRFKADIPFSYHKWTNSSYKEGQFAPCNPYIGLERFFPDSRFSLDFGVRLPLNEQGNYFINENADYYRFSASDYKTWVIRANLHYIKHLPSGFSYQFIFGSFASLRTDSEWKDEWFLNYGGHVRYQYSNFLIGAGIKGIACLTDDFVSGELNGHPVHHRTSHQFYFEVGSPQKNWTPSLYMAFPFDTNISRNSDLNFILGLRVNIHLPS